MNKTTKRRKVWVNELEGDLGSVAWHFFKNARSAAGSNRAAGVESKPVPFVEARPGDVVLSREQVDAISKLLTHAAGVLADGLSEQARYPVRDALALLRGGR